MNWHQVDDVTIKKLILFLYQLQYEKLGYMKIFIFVLKLIEKKKD